MDFLRRTWAEIDTKALEHNFEIIKSKSNGAKIMAVVKANAYGHNYKIVAPVLDKCGADSFAVSNIEEAVKLRNIGIKKEILILGYTPVNLASKLKEYDITQAVFSKDYALSLSQELKKLNTKIKIHIKLDTGMGRIGFDCRTDELSGIDDAIYCAKLEGFILDGIFTHFAVADRNEFEEDGFTDEQYSRFVNAIKKMKISGLKTDNCHCCNSAALCIDGEKHLDMCRAGIILYGLSPSPSLNLHEDFIPVMTFKSVISMIKTVKPNQTINYGRTYKTESERKIATVSVGYADGYNRLLSNRGYVYVKGKKAPIVGRICMDQMSIDITDIDGVKVDDEVILFGKELKVEEISNLCNTINYETVCAVSARVPRIPV